MSIKIKNLSYSYGKNSSMNKDVLTDLNLEINDGDFVALIGPSGSGKSTLLKLIAGLEKPKEGSVSVDGSVSMMFQNPEYQLFEKTIIEDVMYGPLNRGLSKEEAQKASESALSSVGVDKLLYNVSPKKLSGGQKRKVALAGILAMNSSVLLLDEPVSGLDSCSAMEVMNILKALNEKGITIVAVFNSCEYLSDFVSKVVVLNNGRKEAEGTFEILIREYDKVSQLGIEIPEIYKISSLLYKKGLIKENALVHAEEIFRSLSLYQHSL